MIGVVPHVDQERPGQRLGELVRELVEEDERQDLQRAVPGQEAEERQPDGLAEARGRDHSLFGLRRLPGDEQHRKVQERQDHIDRRPSEAPGHCDGRPPGNHQRCTVERDACADGSALLVVAQDLDGIGVDGDVLRRGGEGHRQREGPDDPDRLRVTPDAGEQQADGRQRDLRDRHPAAPPAPERRHVAVHQRRPDHFERPRRLREGEQPDDADVDADVAHPVGDRVPDEAERHARRERQQRDRGRARRPERAGKARQRTRSRRPGCRDHRYEFLTRCRVSGVG